MEPFSQRTASVGAVHVVANHTHTHTWPHTLCTHIVHTHVRCATRPSRRVYIIFAIAEFVPVTGSFTIVLLWMSRGYHLAHRWWRLLTVLVLIDAVLLALQYARATSNIEAVIWLSALWWYTAAVLALVAATHIKGHKLYFSRVVPSRTHTRRLSHTAIPSPSHTHGPCA